MRESQRLTVPDMQPRSFRERWLTWPWRPWVKEKRVGLKPDPNVYTLGGTHYPTYVLGHPQIIQALREAAGGEDRLRAAITGYDEDGHPQVEVGTGEQLNDRLMFRVSGGGWGQ